MPPAFAQMPDEPAVDGAERKLASLGAIPIPQSEYLERLEAAQGNQRLSLPQALAEIQAEAAQSSSSPGKLIAQLLTQTS